MAINRTTVTSAVLITDTSVVVASATDAIAGGEVRLDGENMRIAQNYVAGGLTIPVLRGQEGTPVTAHPVTSSAVIGLASDFSNPSPQTEVLYPIAGRAKNIVSYSAAGAIALPAAGADTMAILNSTTILAMTLANPTQDMDGTILTIIANGQAAHTVDVPDGTGFGGAGSSYDTLTFNASGQAAAMLIAMNAVWCLLGPIGGTLTNTVASVS